MNNKKFLKCVIVFFVSIMSIVPTIEAYQKLQEPDTVYIEYTSKDGVHNTIGMYEPAADNLISEMGEDCFKRLDGLKNSERDKEYLLKDCRYDNSLFFKVLELYEEALNMPTMVDMAAKTDVVMVIVDGKKKIKSLSVKVNKVKKIITELIV